MVFCKIDEELINIIKKYAKGRHIIDVGCGDGLLGSMMKGITSIDIMPRETALIHDIIKMDAVDYPFDDNTFPVFLRPSHGHFISRVLDRYKSNLIDCLYVSNPSNLEIDINIKSYKATQVENWTGEDGEKIYLITINENINTNTGKYKFVRLREGYIPEEESDGTTFWRKEQNGMWINSNGGRCDVHTTQGKNDWIVVETVYADSFEDLDWSKTYLNNPKQTAGWLAPDGTFYGCPYESHDDCAFYIIKLSVQEIEERGYVRIHYKDTWLCQKEITEAQAKFLIENGYGDEFNKLERFGKSWSKARKYMNIDGD